MRIGRLPSLATSAAVLFGFQFPVPAAATDSPLVIGVDHADFANQQPQAGRLFEYTDFFSRQATIHTGDTIDFRSAPGLFISSHSHAPSSGPGAPIRSRSPTMTAAA